MAELPSAKGRSPEAVKRRAEQEKERKQAAKAVRSRINKHAWRHHGGYKFPEEMSVENREMLHGDMHGPLATKLGLGEHTGSPAHTHDNWNVPEEWRATD